MFDLNKLGAFLESPYTALGAAVVIGALAWTTPRVAEVAKTEAPAAEMASLGRLQYVVLVTKLERFVRADQNAVELTVEVKNSNSFLVQFAARLIGVVNGTTLSQPAIEFGGYVGAGATSKLIYGRI